MTTADRIAQILLREGAGETEQGIHSWRCQYPDRYGPCNCVQVVAQAIVEEICPTTPTKDERCQHCSGPIVPGEHRQVIGDDIEGGISAVGTLLRIYKRADGETLGRTLVIVRDAFGRAGLQADVLDGIGYLCGRYNGDLEDQAAVAKLRRVQGGVSGLRGRAEIIRQRTGLTRGHAIAAAAVEIVNSGRGGKKLASWFREDAS